MKDQKFGIEIEMTGLPRSIAAEVLSEYFSSRVIKSGASLDERYVTDSTNRKWRIVSDSSIYPQQHRKHQNNREYLDQYKVEFVSPICKYEDIETIQEIVRALRKNGALISQKCGIHIHIDASIHDAKSLKNIVNIIASKEDLLYKALNVQIDREHYCKKMSLDFLTDLNRTRITNQSQIENLWYKRGGNRSNHYDGTRYQGLNLHSVFNKGTIEFRLFNSTLHAGEIKSYIQLCLAISNQALTQKRASMTKTISSNEKYTFRTWLLRLGFIGEEFKTARLHLLKNLEGNIAWKNPEQANQNNENNGMTLN